MQGPIVWQFSGQRGARALAARLRAAEKTTDSSPAEVQERLDGGGHGQLRPGQEVKLGHGASLVGLQVLQVEAPNQVVVTPDVLRHKVHLQWSQLLKVTSMTMQI